MCSTCFKPVFHPKYEYLGYINSAVRDILFQVRDKISGDREGMFGRSAGGSGEVGDGRRGLKFACVSEPASRVLDCFTSGRLHIRVSGRLQFATVCAKVNKKGPCWVGFFVIRGPRPPRVFLCHKPLFPR